MNWCVYLITNGTRTYIGSTTDVVRRLRQHNTEIVGGARSTRGHTWKLVMYVSGFENRSAACRWERIVKCRARGIENRRNALENLVNGVCPPGGRQSYVPPTGLKVCA